MRDGKPRALNIALLGGAGFIGRHICKAYLDAGHNVLVIDTLQCGSEQAIDPRARLYQVDIRDEKLHSILAMERPQVVSYHVASMHNGSDAGLLNEADVHIRGLLNVLDGCVKTGVGHLIFASGGNTMYGLQEHTYPNTSCFVSEEANLCPLAPHDISKVAGEWYVRHYTQQHGFKHSILRYADVYGETNNEHPAHIQHPLTAFTHMLLERRRPIIQGAGEELRDHIHIDDVVQANLYVLHKGANQTFNISSGKGCTFYQLYQMAAFLLGSNIEPVQYASPKRTLATVLDNSKARQMLNWHPKVDLEEGIRRAVALLRDPEQVEEPVAQPASEEQREVRELAVVGAKAH